MSSGRLAQIGTPREIYSRPVDVTTAEFIGDAVILTAHIENGRARCALGDVAVAPSPNAIEGAARIMLRPEQIEVTTDGAGASGAVVDVEYFGSEMLLGIRLDTADTAMAQRVTVRRFGATALTPGDRVAIRVIGDAVVYDL